MARAACAAWAAGLLMFLVSLQHSLFKVEEEEEAGNGGYQGTNEFKYLLFLSSSGILYSSSAIPHWHFDISFIGHFPAETVCYFAIESTFLHHINNWDIIFRSHKLICLEFSGLSNMAQRPNEDTTYKLPDCLVLIINSLFGGLETCLQNSPNWPSK